MEVIDGTSTFGNGPYYKPTGEDNGPEFTQIVVDFMERMANHNHSGADSKAATLPLKVSAKVVKTSITFVPVVNSSLYYVDINLSLLSPSSLVTTSNNLEYYYKAYADADVDSNYKRFYPTEVRSDTGEIVRLYVISNDIDLKIIG